MRILIFSLLVCCLFAAKKSCPVPELKMLMTGMLNTMGVQEDITKLVECVTDVRGEDWDRVILMISLINWRDPMELVFGFQMYMGVHILAFEDLISCSEKEIPEIIKKIKILMENETIFGEKVRGMASRIRKAVHQFVESWEAHYFEEAGMITGRLINEVFFDGMHKMHK